MNAVHVPDYMNELAERAYGKGAEVRADEHKVWIAHSGAEAVAARSLGYAEAMMREKIRRDQGLITAAEVAKLLGVARTSLPSLVARGDLRIAERDPGSRGKTWFRPADVQAWRDHHPKRRRKSKAVGSLRALEAKPTNRGRPIKVAETGTSAGIRVQIPRPLVDQLTAGYQQVRIFGVSYSQYIQKILERGLER